VPQPVEIGGPAAEVALLHAGREPLVSRAVTQRGDRDRVVRPTRSVREPEEVEQARTIVGRDLGHPLITERGFEFVLVFSGDGVDLVQEQHGASFGLIDVARDVSCVRAPG
jgi:hypothetical protein